MLFLGPGHPLSGSGFVVLPPSMFAAERIEVDAPH